MVHLLLSLLWPVMGVIGLKRIVYVNDQSLNWRAAQAYCREHYTDLVTIETEEDNDQINENSWIGLYRDNSSSAWKWSCGDGPLTFSNTWHNDDPDDGDDCVYKEKGDNGEWRSKKCSDSKKFFCVDENPFLVSQMKTWEEALAHCRAMTSGDHHYNLASLITAEDHEYVRSQITDEVWTGLRFLGDHWVWVSGEEVQYGGIKSCPEIKRCGMLDKSSTQDYNIGKCEEKKHFLCYRKPTAA